LSVVWTVNAITEYGLHIEGEIRHKAGHAVPISYDLPMPDKVTGQNAAQQMGSATTYARRYALTAALGIVTGEDDDGLAAGTQYVTKEQADELVAMLDMLADRECAMAAMLEYAECDSVADIPADKFAKCKRGLLTKPKK
jgi:hypothetical protein